MPGIIVGIDGSAHSRRALEWAVREATVRRAPLTVLTVQQPVTVYCGAGAVIPYPVPNDQELAEQARKMAEEETRSALEQASSDSRPRRSWSRALSAWPPRRSCRPPRTPARFTVTVKDGVVTIEGTPETSLVGHDIIDAIRHMEGVVFVRDRLSYPKDSPYRPGTLG